MALPYSEMTLDQALIAFRKANALDAKYAGMDQTARSHFERHDMIHVLFGLDTSLRHEAQADGWTLMASDISWTDIRAFMKLTEEQELIAEIGPWAIAWGFVRAVPDYMAMAWRARRLHKKWPWCANDSYRERKVAEIRREFGINQALGT